MVLIDLNITAIVAFLVSVFALITAVTLFWDKFTSWWGNITGKKMIIKSLPEDSPIKQEFDTVHDNIEKILINQEINQEKLEIFEGDLLEIRITKAIEHDYGVDEVLKLFNKYKAMGRNGYIEWKVEQYVHPRADITMNDYFEKLNIDNKNKEKQ